MAQDTLLGRHAVLEALRSDRQVRRLLIAGHRGSPPDSMAEAVALAKKRGITVHTVNRQTLDRMGAHHGGIAAEVEAYGYVEVADILNHAKETGNPPLIVVIDSVQDPQNFGTLLRTAVTVGAHGAIIPKHRAVSVTPSVERASAGAVARLQVAQATNLARAIDELREAGIWVYGIDARAPVRYDEVDLAGPLALVVGSEGEGLGRLVAEHCDRLIRIPMVGGVDSLNVAVAGSIVLAEVFRAREKAGQIVEGALPPKPKPTKHLARTGVQESLEDDLPFTPEDSDDQFVDPERPFTRGRVAGPNAAPPRNSKRFAASGDRAGKGRPAGGNRPGGPARSGPSRGGSSGGGPNRGGGTAGGRPPRRSGRPPGMGGRGKPGRRR